MITADQAIATAQQWEAEKAAGPSALVGRALLAHINSLASPQVTDEQISQILRDVWDHGYYSPSTYNDIDQNTDHDRDRYYRNFSEDAIKNLRALLSAQPAAETPLTDVALCPACLTEVQKAAPQEAVAPIGYIAADAIERLKDNRIAAVGTSLNRLPTNNSIAVYAAPQTPEAKPVAAESMPKEWLHLYMCINHLMAHLGAYGEITTRFTVVNATMDALVAIDGGTVSKRAIELHDKASMPLFDATELAVSEHGEPTITRSALPDTATKDAIEAALLFINKGIGNQEHLAKQLSAALAAAPQEKAPADKDAIRNAALEAGTHAREQLAQRILEFLGKNGKENAASLLLYEAMKSLKQSQPQQVTK